MSQTETDAEASSRSGGAEQRAIPGIVLVYRGSAACCLVLPLGRTGLVLGRETAAALVGGDRRMSRAHAEVRFESGRWSVRDLGSRNGTFLEGKEIQAETTERDQATLRLAESVFLLVRDVRPFQDGVTADGFVAGPSMRACLRRIEHVAAKGRDLLVLGETGSGKEIAAGVFHRAGSRAGAPMISVNCATVPEGLAERLLFGARKGAYSGASDAAGFLAEAHGKVLFLDEVGELDVKVQAKLLRFLETREITPLGATQSHPVDVQICFATHRDLRGSIAGGGVREDFFYRIGRPAVPLPPLRERREEIPWLVARELSADGRGLTAQAKLVETCILSSWPGNVRELLHAVRGAADRAADEETLTVRAEHLGDPPRPSPPPPRATAPLPSRPAPSKHEIEASLERHRGNVATTARALGVHRRQLYRLFERHGIAPVRPEEDA